MKTRMIDGKTYSSEPSSFAWRLTDCCAALSDFHDGALSCNTCGGPVEAGEGDGHEVRTVRKERYFAVRVWCHTDKKLLWKVLTRPCLDRRDANTYLEMERDERREKGIDEDPTNYFIIAKMVDVPNVEYNEI